MNRKAQPLLLSLNLVFVLCLSAASVTANPRFSIDDLTDSVTFTIDSPNDGTTTGFSSFTAGGITLMGNGSIAGLSEAGPISFIGIWTDSGTSNGGFPSTTNFPRDFYFVEGPLLGGTGIGQAVSDLLHIAAITRAPDTNTFTIVGTFSSDNETGLLVPGGVPVGTAPGRITVEDGTFQSLFTPGDLRIRGRSDVPETVPEPGTLALLGVGLAGLAASRRRRSS